MKTLQDRLPVTMIATPRNALLTCRSDDTLAAVIIKIEGASTSYPVIDADDGERKRIIGLIELVPYVRDKTDRRHRSEPDGAAV